MEAIKITDMENSGNIAEMAISYIAKQKPSERPQITTSLESYELLKQCFNGDTLNYSEEFILLLLNTTNRVLGWIKISAGGLVGTGADCRIIFACALQTGATKILISHNHPGGSSKPSQPDIDLTKKIKAGGELLEIQLLDHIIITDDSYFSFADQGML